MRVRGGGAWSQVFKGHGKWQSEEESEASWTPVQRKLTWDEEGPEVSRAESSDPAPSHRLLTEGAPKQQQQ